MISSPAALMVPWWSDGHFALHDDFEGDFVAVNLAVGDGNRGRLAGLHRAGQLGAVLLEGEGELEAAGAVGAFDSPVHVPEISVAARAVMGVSAIISGGTDAEQCLHGRFLTVISQRTNHRPSWVSSTNVYP